MKEIGSGRRSRIFVSNQNGVLFLYWPSCVHFYFFNFCRFLTLNRTAIYEPYWNNFVVSLTKVTSSIPNAWRSLQKICAEGGLSIPSPPPYPIRPLSWKSIATNLALRSLSKFLEQIHLTCVCAGSKVLIAWFRNLWSHVWLTRAKIIYFKWLILRLIKEEFPFYIFPILFDYIFSRSCLITYFPDPVSLILSN